MHSKPLTRLLRLVTVISPLLVLMGCFGDGNGPQRIPATAIPPVTGVFIDSPISGAGWQTSDGESGITNDLGEFTYVPGTLVTFSVGGIVLGSAPGAPLVSSVDLTGSNNPTDQAAVNQFVFLQSIDSDQDPTNGITISSSTQAAAANQTLDFNDANFRASVAAVVAAIAPGNRVISNIEALAHFYTTFADLGGTDTFSFSFPGFPPTRSGVTYELAFADEFDVGTAPDPTKWNYELGYGDFGWGNNEWQQYTDSADNVRIEDGNLVIQARCDTPPCGVRDGSITSGRITTQDKFEFRYGSVVARIKPPVGDGAWPAFWSLGAVFPETPWPRAGEIDFMEMHNAFSDDRTTHFTMHWCDETINPSLPSTEVCFPQDNGWIFDSQNRTFPTSLGDDFHLFEADWDQNRMIGRIDGITYFERVIESDTMEEFLREFFMILNVAMGGTLGSDQLPPSDFFAQQDRNEVWPQTMLVDYVRVFQRTDAPTQNLFIDFEDTSTAVTFNNFEGGVADVVMNPAQEGINTSARVGRLRKLAATSGLTFGGSTIVTAFDLPQSSAFTAKVWSQRAVNVLFKLEGVTGAEVEVAHGGTGWEELTFQFADLTGTATGITFIFDNGTLGNADTDPNNWTFYIDDIRRTMLLSQIDLPITFDDQTVNYTLTDFGDPVAAVTTLVADPDDAENTVASTIKPAMAPGWAGTTMSTPAGLASPIPFTASETTIGVRVYSPAAGIVVRLKADDTVNGSISVETERTTTVANQWETLVFDFADEVDGTSSLDLGTSYSALSIFFNFDIAGDDSTYLWDDVVFGVPVPDTTAPELNTVSVESNNANPTLAKTGDVVTVTLSADESIAAPMVTISGIIADSVNGGGANWVASRTLTSAATDGVVTLSVEFADVAGNAGIPVSATTDASSVTIDTTAPGVAIVGAPATFTTLDPIPVMFEFSEAVTGFTLADIQATNGTRSGFAAIDADTYMVNIRPNGNGDLTVSVAAGVAADLAGNTSLAATAITISNNLDAEAPLLTVVSISAAPTSGYARTGDVVRIDLTADEEIIEPVVTIAGVAAETVTGSGTTWAASRTMLATDTEGEIAFVINFEDLGGNAGPQTTGTTDSSSVIFDITAPTLSINGVPDPVQTVDPFTVTFQFNEDVSGFVLGDIDVSNGTAGAFVSTDAASYTADITPDGNGDLIISVAAGAATDLAGNDNTADSVSTTLDLQPLWQQVWSDNFDGVALSSNWTARTDVDCPDPCEGVQSYLSERVSVGAGLLTIEARSGTPITSGLIDTRGNRQLRYGRVEIDTKLPMGTTGITPSLRMLPETGEPYGPWPLSGEIDITNSPNVAALEQTLRYGLPEPENTTATDTSALPGMASSRFVTYAIEWEGSEIRWFADGVHVASQIPDNWYSYSEDADGVYTLGTGAAPFDQDFYLLIGLDVDASGGTYPRILQVDAVRVFQCANAVDPSLGTGCAGLIDAVDPGVTPVVATDPPYNSAPYTEELEVYTDAPATLDFEANDGMTTAGTLVPGTFNDPGVTVSSTINATDGTNTIWNVNINANSGTGGVLMGPADLGAATGYFDLSGGGTAGEVLFRMRVMSATSDPQLQVKLENATAGSGVATLDFTADGVWRQHSVKISDIVSDSVLRGTSLDLASLVNLFALQAVGGAVILDLDDISVKVACRDVDRCEATARLSQPMDVELYFENFESLDAMDGAALGDWLVFGNVFNGGTGAYLYGYGPNPAPNGTGGFSNVAIGEGGGDQGDQQLVVFNDYNNTSEHTNGNLVEGLFFHECTISNDYVGGALTFSFDAKHGDLIAPTEAIAFIKTLDPNAGFAQTSIVSVDAAAFPDTWANYQLTTEAFAAGFVGQLVQIGFSSTTTNFTPSGTFYDNVRLEISATDSGNVPVCP